jgi:hypothetical protein
MVSNFVQGRRLLPLHGGEAGNWLDRVRVPTLHRLTLDQWMDEFRKLRETNRRLMRPVENLQPKPPDDLHDALKSAVQSKTLALIAATVLSHPEVPRSGWGFIARPESTR